MARYFSDLDNGTTKYVDVIGTELADVALVPKEAIRLLAQVLRDEVAKNDDDDDRVMVVSTRNEAGKIIHRAKLTIETESNVRSGLEMLGHQRSI
jgi:peptide subunit release factor 1 (eRF1)